MMSVIFVYLCCLYVVNANYSNLKRTLEWHLDKPLGVLGCRNQCKDRKACVDVNYFPDTMSCVLKLNISTLKGVNICRTVFCVQRSIQTRTGPCVTVLEIYADHPTRERRFHFIPLNKNPCRVSGKGRNILKPTPGTSYRSGCKARVYQTFLCNGKYSWTVRVEQTDKVNFIVQFLFESVQTRKTVLEFVLIKLENNYVIQKSDLQRVYCKSPPTLKFTLSRDIVHVKDFNTEKTLLTKRLSNKPDDRLKLLMDIKVKGLSNMKIILQSNRSE